MYEHRDQYRVYPTINAHSPQSNARCSFLTKDSKATCFKAAGAMVGPEVGCAFLNLEYIHNSSYEKAGATVDLAARSFQLRWSLYHPAAAGHEIKER